MSAISTPPISSFNGLLPISHPVPKPLEADFVSISNPGAIAEEEERLLLFLLFPQKIKPPAFNTFAYRSPCAFGDVMRIRDPSAAGCSG